MELQSIPRFVFPKAIMVCLVHKICLSCHFIVVHKAFIKYKICLNIVIDKINVT